MLLFNILCVFVNKNMKLEKDVLLNKYFFKFNRLTYFVCLLLVLRVSFSSTSPDKLVDESFLKFSERIVSSSVKSNR